MTLKLFSLITLSSKAQEYCSSTKYPLGIGDENVSTEFKAICSVNSGASFLLAGSSSTTSMISSPGTWPFLTYLDSATLELE